MEGIQVTETAPPPAIKLGRPYTALPIGLTTLLDHSYIAGPQSVAVPAGDRGAISDAVRLARIYVRRKGKTLHWQPADGLLWLHMADKRPYTRRTP